MSDPNLLEILHSSLKVLLSSVFGPRKRCADVMVLITVENSVVLFYAVL